MTRRHSKGLRGLGADGVFRKGPSLALVLSSECAVACVTRSLKPVGATTFRMAPMECAVMRIASRTLASRMAPPDALLAHPPGAAVSGGEADDASEAAAAADGDDDDDDDDDEEEEEEEEEDTRSALAVLLSQLLEPRPSGAPVVVVVVFEQEEDGLGGGDGGVLVRCEEQAHDQLRHLQVTQPLLPALLSRLFPFLGRAAAAAALRLTFHVAARRHGSLQPHARRFGRCCSSSLPAVASYGTLDGSREALAHCLAAPLHWAHTACTATAEATLPLSPWPPPPDPETRRSRPRK